MTNFFAQSLLGIVPVFFLCSTKARVVVNAQGNQEEPQNDNEGDATVGAPCTLECLNGGTCQFGIKEYDIDVYPKIYNVFWLPNNLNEMYCECPLGYFGTTCDVTSSPCYNNADGELMFYCFNGSTCDEITEVDGTIGYRCNCLHQSSEPSPAGDDGEVPMDVSVGEPQPDGATATTRTIDHTDEGRTEAYYAGEYCQSKSTSICSSDDGLSLNGVLFCTNGGQCREDA